MNVTTAARTWIDLAAVVSLQYLVAAGDVLLRQGHASSRELRAAVAWARGRRGVRAAKKALELLDPRAESPAESRVRCILVTAGLPRPECNAEIVADGGWIARADLAWRAQKLIVEYDGMVHLPEWQRRKDAARRNLLQDAGWQVIVLTARDLAHPAAMVDIVRRALAART